MAIAPCSNRCRGQLVCRSTSIERPTSIDRIVSHQLDSGPESNYQESDRRDPNQMETKQVKSNHAESNRIGPNQLESEQPESSRRESNHCEPYPNSGRASIGYRSSNDTTSVDCRLQSDRTSISSVNPGSAAIDLQSISGTVSVVRRSKIDRTKFGHRSAYPNTDRALIRYRPRKDRLLVDRDRNDRTR